MTDKAVGESEKEHILTIDHTLACRRHRQARRRQNGLKSQDRNVAVSNRVTDKRRFPWLPSSISENVDRLLVRQVFDHVLRRDEILPLV